MDRSLGFSRDLFHVSNDEVLYVYNYGNDEVVFIDSLGNLGSIQTTEELNAIEIFRLKDGYYVPISTNRFNLEIDSEIGIGTSARIYISCRVTEK